MAYTITKVWDVAGSLPGQRIELKLEFHKRACRKVTVKYEFEVRSLGYEHFGPSQRWNKTTIWIHGIPFTWTYNLFGDRVVWRKTGDFTIDGVEDALRLMRIEFLNERLGNFGSDPYTTGVITREILGNLEILENDRFDLSFHHGFEDDTIRDLPPRMYDYWGRNVIIPLAPPIDPSGRYRCIGWTHVPPTPGMINLAKPLYKLGDPHLLEKSLKLYACWEPLPHKWEFFLDEAFKDVFYHRPGEFPNPINPFTGQWIDLPDLRHLHDKFGRSVYFKPGYEFGGWYWYDRKGILHHGFRCNEPYPVRFWPYWIPKRLEIVFDFGWGMHQIIRTFLPNEAFRFLDIMYNPEGKLIPGPTMIRPGFQLIGWTVEPVPTHIWYRPGMKIPPPNFWFDFNGIIHFTKRIVVHAVWIKLSDAYVYTKGKWLLAAPFVYTEDHWNLAHADIYTRDDWRM